MCVILVMEKGRLTEQELQNAWRANPHGAGIVIRGHGGLTVYRGIAKMQNLIDVYATIPDVPHLLHTRLATVGGISPQLTHPMVISRTSPVDVMRVVDDRHAWLVHNGHVTDWETLGVTALCHGARFKGPTSDTRILAALVAIAGPQVLAILDATAVISRPGSFVKYGSTWSILRDGIYQSNRLWSYNAMTYTVSDGVWQGVCNEQYKKGGPITKWLDKNRAAIEEGKTDVEGETQW